MTLMLLSFTSCSQTDNKDETWNHRIADNQENIRSEIVAVKKDIQEQDTIVLKEAFQENDIIVNEYLNDRPEPIRKNFKRINSIADWSFIDKKDLRESTEGGMAKFYHANKVLEKIVVRHFGETLRQLTEFYLLDGQLSFVFDKSYEYNQPMYWDSTRMKDNNDNQTFDLDKSEIQEDRSYFESGELLHKIKSGDCGSPFAAKYVLEEQLRLTAQFEKLVEPVKKK